MMRALFAALAVLLLAPASARAADAEATAPTQDRAEEKLNEVERGVFFSAEGGGGAFFSPKGTNSGLSLARTLGIDVGVDLGEKLALGVYVLGIHVDTPSTFVAKGSLRGDFSSLSLGAFAKFAFLGSPDEANPVNRKFVYGKAGAGVGLLSPKGAYDSVDIQVLAGIGFEYFTHLRHFSVGIDADFVMGLAALGPGAIVEPHVRYTF